MALYKRGDKVRLNASHIAGGHEVTITGVQTRRSCDGRELTTSYVVDGRDERGVRFGATCTERDLLPIKPPLGVMPKFIWLEHRQDELRAAIKRYVDAGLTNDRQVIRTYEMIVELQEVQAMLLKDQDERRRALTSVRK